MRRGPRRARVVLREGHARRTQRTPGPRHALHPRGPGARSRPRRGDDADRPLQHVRPGRPRRLTRASTTRAPATRRATALEGCLAALEGGKHGVAFGSGCAATTTVAPARSRAATTCSCGDDVYGGTFRIFDKVLEAVRHRGHVPRHERPVQACAPRSRPTTRLVWLETPSEPDAEGLRHRRRRGRSRSARARGSPSTTRSRRRSSSGRSSSARRWACTRRRST